MSESDPKHTPGPWEFEGNSLQGRWESGERVQIASLNTSHWSTDPLHDDVEANRKLNARMRVESKTNAALIAAAPELLDACKRAMRELPILDRHQDSQRCQALLQILDEAIAKAAPRG